MHLFGLPGVLGTARWNGDASNRARPVRLEAAASTSLDGGSAGSGTGSYHRRDRATPAEERTLTSGVLSKTVRRG